MEMESPALVVHEPEKVACGAPRPSVLPPSAPSYSPAARHRACGRFCCPGAASARRRAARRSRASGPRARGPCDCPACYDDVRSRMLRSPRLAVCDHHEHRDAAHSGLPGGFHGGGFAFSEAGLSRGRRPRSVGQHCSRNVLLELRCPLESPQGSGVPSQWSIA